MFLLTFLSFIGSKIDNKVLIDRAKKGCVNSFEELTKLHCDKIFTFALSIAGGDYPTASDLYQEAVLKAFLNIKSFVEPNNDFACKSCLI